jgi:hypothetical protein
MRSKSLQYQKTNYLCWIYDSHHVSLKFVRSVMIFIHLKNFESLSIKPFDKSTTLFVLSWCGYTQGGKEDMCAWRMVYAIFCILFTYFPCNFTKIFSCSAFNFGIRDSVDYFSLARALLLYSNKSGIYLLLQLISNSQTNFNISKKSVVRFGRFCPLINWFRSRNAEKWHTVKKKSGRCKEGEAMIAQQKLGSDLINVDSCFASVDESNILSITFI